MRLPFLKRLVDAVIVLSDPNRVVILGSSSLLVEAPELGDLGQPLEISLDADLLIEPIDQLTADMLRESIGTNSLFEQRSGYHADILRPTIAGALPPAWESRLRPVPGYAQVFALDRYDLALVKLMLGRAKDLALLRDLLRLGLIEPERLRQHYQRTPLKERESVAAGRNLQALLGDGTG